MLLLVAGAGGSIAGVGCGWVCVVMMDVMAGDALVVCVVMVDVAVAGDTMAGPFSQDCLRFCFLSPSDPGKVSSAHDWHRKWNPGILKISTPPVLILTSSGL